MALMQSCCCWRSLRKGAYASAIYTLVYFSITVLIMTVFVRDEWNVYAGVQELPTSPTILEIGRMSRLFELAVWRSSVLSVLASRGVNVDSEVSHFLQYVAKTLESSPEGALPLDSLSAVWRTHILPFEFRLICSGGYCKTPQITRRLGSTMNILNENETVANLKFLVGAADFNFASCKISSTISPEINFSLEGTLSNTDFDVSVALYRQPNCKAILRRVSVVDIGSMSFKFLEGSLPRAVVSILSYLFAETNKKLMNDEIVKAVEGGIARTAESADLCAIFHPNVRPKEEL